MTRPYMKDGVKIHPASVAAAATEAANARGRELSGLPPLDVATPPPPVDVIVVAPGDKSTKKQIAAFIEKYTGTPVDPDKFTKKQLLDSAALAAEAANQDAGV